MADIEYFVEKSHRRTLSLAVKPDGSVVVKAPLFVRNSDIKRFVDSHADWIAKNVIKNAARSEQISRVEPLTDTELKELKKKARELIMPLVEEYAEIMGVTYGTVAIRAQKSRFGSCSGKGNLNFNCVLALCPEGAMRYVVVHELCHRRHMNHSRAFWSMVEDYMPDYREHRLWLKRNGDVLMARIGKQE